MKIFRRLNVQQTLHKILHKLGFDFNKQDSRTFIEKEDIILRRRKYLRQINNKGKQIQPLYFLDETWVNAGHVKTKAWLDKIVKNKRHAFQKGLSTGPRTPPGLLHNSKICGKFIHPHNQRKRNDAVMVKHLHAHVSNQLRMI